MKKFFEIIKSAGVASYLCIAAALFGLAGTIIFSVTNSTAGYAVANGGIGIALGFVAVAVLVVSIFLPQKFKADLIVVAVLRLVAMVLFFLDISLLVLSRAELASALLTWDSHNQVGWNTLYVSIAGVAMFIISSLCIIVGAFFGKGSKESVRVA